MSAVQHERGKPQRAAVKTPTRSKKSSFSLMWFCINVVALIWHTVRMMFTGHIRLQRKKSGLHIVLQDKPAKTANTERDSAETKNKRAATAELTHITKELSTALDRHFRARTTLRHLAAFEHALINKGSAAFDELSSDAITRVMHQLEVLSATLSSKGLATLRSWLTIAAVDREQAEEDDEIQTTGRSGPATMPLMSDFNIPGKLEVAEVGDSVLSEADLEWFRPK